MIKSYHTTKIYNEYMISYESYNTLNKVIFIPENIASQPIINRTISFIKSGQFHQLDRYLKTVNKDEQYLPFANGLLHLFKKEYNLAATSFHSNQIDELRYITELLIVDCLYEIALTDAYVINYYSFLGEYQKIMDKYHLDDTYTEIINDRIKFINYNK